MRTQAQKMWECIIEKKTGVFVAKSKEVAQAFAFDRGEVCATRSSDKESYLGPILVKMGYLKETTLELILKGLTGDLDLTTLLLDKKLIDQKSIKAALDGQLELRFLKFLSNENEQVELLGRDLVSFKKVAPRTNTAGLFLKTLHRYMDPSLRLEEVPMECLPSKKQALFSTQILEHLSEAEQKCFFMISGTAPLHVLNAKTGIHPKDVYRLLLVWNELGIVEIELPKKLRLKKVSFIIAELEGLKRKNYFERLNVSVEANYRDIHLAFESIVAKLDIKEIKKSQEDAYDLNAIDEYMKCMQVAYDCLMSEKARQVYMKSLNSGVVAPPALAEISYHQAEACLKSKQYVKAMVHIEKALVEQPTSPKYQMLQGWIQCNLGFEKEMDSLILKGKFQIQTAFLQVSNKDLGHYYLGMIERAIGDEQFAEKHFLQALALNPLLKQAELALKEIQSSKESFLKKLFNPD